MPGMGSTPEMFNPLHHTVRQTDRQMFLFLFKEHRPQRVVRNKFDPILEYPFYFFFKSFNQLKSQSSLFDIKNKHFHQIGVQHFSGQATQDFDSLRRILALAIWTVRGHGVEKISHADDTRAERNIRAA